jgi:branched-chain amino acid transport system substrate-binding protein
MSLRAEARLMAQQAPDVTRWSAVCPDIEYGHVTWNAFAGGLKEFYPKLAGKEITIVDPIFTTPIAGDYKQVIVRMLASGANGVYSGLTGAPLVTFLTQCHAADVDKTVSVWGDVGIDVTLGHELHRNMPKAYWTPTIWYSRAPGANDLTKFLLKRYAELTKDELPAGLLTSSFSPLLGYAAAIRAAGSAEPAKVASTLETLTFDSPVGPVTYRKEDHQAMYKLGFIRMSAADNPDGYAVTGYSEVAATDVIEPPNPGVAFTFPEVK